MLPFFPKPFWEDGRLFRLFQLNIFLVLGFKPSTRPGPLKRPELQVPTFRLPGLHRTPTTALHRVRSMVSRVSRGQEESLSLVRRLWTRLESRRRVSKHFGIPAPRRPGTPGTRAMVTTVTKVVTKVVVVDLHRGGGATGTTSTASSYPYRGEGEICGWR